MAVPEAKIARRALLTRLYLAMSGSISVPCGHSAKAWNIGMADDQRRANKLRSIALLHRGIEGVAVDVGDAEGVDLRVGEEPCAAAPPAGLGPPVDDAAAIPAQVTRHAMRHGSRRSSPHNSGQRAPEMTPPCASEDAYYVSRRRHGAFARPAFQQVGRRSIY